MGRALKVLTIGEIVEINRRIIDKFGGVFFKDDHNLIYPGSLEHVLEEIQGTLFEKEIYSTITEKGAAITWRIIKGHVFYDGNKRTGMEACRMFLELNGYKMIIDPEVVDMALKIASNDVNFSTFIKWIEDRTERISSGDYNEDHY